MLHDRLEVAVHHGAAVERADGQRDPQWFHQEAHADGRAARRDGEADAGVFEFLHGRLGRVGEAFIVRDERAIDIGHHESDLGHGLILQAGSCFVMAFTMPSMLSSMDTVIGRSSGPGTSSVLNWLSSSDGGMKWFFRAAIRFAISSLAPSR